MEEDKELNQEVSAPSATDKTDLPETPVGADAGAQGQDVPAEQDAPAVSRLDAFLDNITEKPEDGQDGVSHTVEVLPASEGALSSGVDPASGGVPPVGLASSGKVADGMKPDAPTPEQIEAELMAEVKSERGQNRIRELLSGHRQLRQEYDSMRDETARISETLAQTGLPPEGLARVFDVCRLMASDDENDLKVALKTLDETRADICKRLGIAQPGVDVLGDFPDLKQAVEEMEITQDKAMELAKLRRLQVTRQQEVQQQQAAFRQQQEYAERVQGFSRAATALFGQLAASDPAYRVKEAKIAEALRNPAFVQNMIAKFQPEQWLDQLRFMYDAIPATVATPTRRATPISSRPSRLGVSVSPEATGADRVDQLLRSVGI